MTVRGAGKVVAVCAGERRGQGKEDVGRGYLQRDYGLVGDAHAGAGDRQVSLVSLADVRAVALTRGVEGGPGDFAANIGVEGLDVAALPAGTLLGVGEAMLEVRHIGKRDAGPHHFSYRGVALLVEKGAFCRVVRSGWVKTGDPVVVIADDALPPED